MNKKPLSLLSPFALFLRFLTISIIVLFTCTTLTYSQTLQEIDNLKNQYEEMLNSQELKKPKKINDAEQIINSTSLPDKIIYTRKEVESLIANTQKLLDKLNDYEDTTSTLKYIGYDIFSQRDSVEFWQNLPTPPDYILGPGDEIVVTLHGTIEQYISGIINRDGLVFLKGIGSVSLNGLSVTSSKNLIKKRYSKLYSTLSSNNPTTFIDITLGELKSINIHIVGFVNLPGIHIIHPFSSVLSSLSQAGGVDLNGSLRDIRIIRNGKIIASVDLYNYLFIGKLLNDIRILDQDIIFIPPRKNTAAVTGEVKKTGYFELNTNETINDLLEFSGGFTSRASDNIFLTNNNQKNHRSNIFKYSKFLNVVIKNGDSLHVPSLLFSEEYIMLGGQVKSPGKYPYQNDMSINDLLIVDGSLNDIAFKNTMDIENISIFRRKEKSKEFKRIIVDLREDNYDFKIKKFDQISVGQNIQNKPLKSVIISGEIENPGLYNANNKKTLGDLIDLSGGFTDDALFNGIEIFRDSLLVGWNSMNFVLNDNDSVNVLAKSGIIQILGEVNNPGYITYNKKYKIKDYINLAGGYAAFAEPRNVYIVQPNGTAQPMKKFRRKPVPEGSKIIVNKRSLSGYSNNQRAFEAIASQASSLATTLLTLILLFNQVNNSNG